MSSPIQDFSDNLKLIRKGRNLTQTQLAEKMGLTKQSIINYEKGLTFPTGKKLENLLTALNVSTEQLLGKDLSQSTSQKRLMENCNTKGIFWGEYQKIRNNDDNIKKDFLLNHLSQFNSDQLFHAISEIYDKNIKQAQIQYINEISDSIAYPQESLNIDLWIKQEE